MYRSRSNVLTALGIRASSNPLQATPAYTGYYIIFNFLFAYAALSSRGIKKHYGLDHNTAPREDVSTYGEEAVKSGKITRATLNKIKRNEAAHANAVEHFPFFVGALLWAHQVGLPLTTINTSAAVYTLARMLFAAVYIWGEGYGISLVRTAAWWTGNVTCLRLFWLGTKALNNLKA